MLNRLKSLSLGLLLVLVLAACGEAGGGPTATPGTGGTTASPTAAAEPTEGAPDGTPSGTGLPDLGGRKFIVGSDTTYPPMESIDEQTGKPIGFDVDMMAEMGKVLNAQFDFQTFPNFDAIFAALAQGQFDLVVSSVSVTEERKQVIDFSDPYLSIGQAIAARKDTTTIKSVDDLKNVQFVGVQGGTTGEEAVKKAGVPDDKIRRYDTIDLAFQDLTTGAIDAVVADGPPVARYTDQFKDVLTVVGEPFTTEDYAIAIQKGDAELVEAINAGLKELKANGTMARLMEKWNLTGVATTP